MILHIIRKLIANVLSLYPGVEWPVLSTLPHILFISSFKKIMKLIFWQKNHPTYLLRFYILYKSYSKWMNIFFISGLQNWIKFYDFFQNRGKLSEIRYYAWFFSMARNPFLNQRIFVTYTFNMYIWGSRKIIFAFKWLPL